MRSLEVDVLRLEIPAFATSMKLPALRPPSLLPLRPLHAVLAALSGGEILRLGGSAGPFDEATVADLIIAAPGELEPDEPDETE